MEESKNMNQMNENISVSQTLFNCCANSEINNMELKLALMNLLVQAATILSRLNDEKSKNVVLDIAEEHLTKVKQEYVEKLDEDVLSIIDEVKNSL